MDTRLTEEQEALVSSTRQMLSRYCPPDLVRAVRAPDGSGHSEDLWKHIIDAGWLELALAEEGAPPTSVELGLICREAGRAMVPTVFYSVLEALLLVDGLADGDKRTELVDGILDGSLVPTVAMAEPGRVNRTGAVESVACRVEDGWIITADKIFVRNAAVSDVVIIGCRTDAGEPAFFVAPASEVHLHPHATFGHDAQSRLTATRLLLPAEARLGVSESPVEDVWTSVRSRMTAMTCMDLVGCIEALLDATVDHVKVRNVFGKPLGSFQAAQHIVADIAIKAKGAELASLRAAWAVGVGPAEHEVAIAKAWTGRAAKQASVMAHQLHGGMGFVTETDLHLWSDRVVGMDAAYGTAMHHIATIAGGLDVHTPAMGG